LGQRYNKKLADLLAVQSDIAREVSQRLDSRLSNDDRKKLTKGSTDNPEAYRFYLKGKFYTDQFTKQGFDTGIDYFNQAIAGDPNYGLAYSGLAYNYINQIDWFMPPSEAGPKTREAAEKASAIDASDARAHLTLALVTQRYQWNWAAAESEFKQTIALSPNNTEAHTVSQIAGFRFNPTEPNPFARMLSPYVRAIPCVGTIRALIPSAFDLVHPPNHP
jgi:adenylate cyclase